MCVCVGALVHVHVHACDGKHVPLHVSVCARVTVQRSPLAGLSVKVGINELGLR